MAADLSKTVKVVCELHINISAVNVYVTPSFSYSRLNLTLQADCFSLSIFSGEELMKTLKLSSQLPGLFIPTSFRSIKGRIRSLEHAFEDGIVTIVLENPSGDPHEDSCVFRLLTNFNAQEKNDGECGTKLYGLKPDVPYVIRCKSCYKELTKEPVMFKRIVEMPEDLTELFENWFCHKHDHEMSVEQKTDHLFITLTCFLLKCLDYDCVYKNEKSVYCCRNCDSCLSSKVACVANDARHPIPCFKDKILFDGSLEAEVEICSVKCPARTALMEMIRNTLSTSIVCKLYLETDASSRKENCLLLWVMDADMKRCVVEESSSNSSKELEFSSVMKVLYHVTTPETSQASEWRHTFSMDFHHVSDTMFEDVVNLLHQNKYTLQEIDSELPGFSINRLTEEIEADILALPPNVDDLTDEEDIDDECTKTPNGT